MSSTSKPVLDDDSRSAGAHARARRGGIRSLIAGGTAGNEELTSIVGLILIVLFAVIGVTIVRIGQLLWLHLFVGLLLLGPLALKLASTGYRFARYYVRDAVYRKKGPPELLLRVLAPGLVTLTLTVFVSGVVLLFEGPAHRGTLLLIHKVSFIVWIAFFGLHILGHVPQLLAGSWRAARTRPAAELTDGSGVGLASSGAAGRVIAVTGVVVAGAVLAIVLIPDFAIWTAHGAIHHH